MAASRVHLNRQRQLHKLAHQLATTSDCPLRATAIQAVAGEGNPMAKVMFIGEAPGRQEDETGKPFVGAAGKMLNQLLEILGLGRSDVFITSIEKFRPPNNRDPKPKEIMACFPYLQAQIQIIQPAVIVTLGRHALRRMLEWEKGDIIKDHLSMDQLHGRIFRGSSGQLYFPVHHPAAILYQRSLQTIVKADFAKLKNILSQLH